MWEIWVQQTVNGLSAGMAYALVALGLTLIFGVLHVINFAHGELYMIGALGLVILVNQLGIPYPLEGTPAAEAPLAARARDVILAARRAALEKPGGRAEE